jgi:CRISPR-associated protein Csd1
MSWVQALYETYERCATRELTASSRSGPPLLPVSHTSQQAHIEVIINEKGEFLRARVIGREDTIVPATESSAGRTSGASPHPLCDKIQYCAGDYAEWGGQKDSYYDLYVAQLKSWSESPFSHPKVEAVFSYISRRTLVSDLVVAGVLIAKDGILLTAWEDKEKEPPEVFKHLVKKRDDGEAVQDQGDALVRWVVQTPGVLAPESWTDSTLIEAWRRYDASRRVLKGVCIATGVEGPIADQHPAKLRHSGDKAKLISSNDKAGFTFRGRFVDDEGAQACVIGFDTTQKAHSALRWLIARQGYRNGEQVYVAWSMTDRKIPNPFSTTLELFGIEEAKDDEEGSDPIVTKSVAVDIGQAFALRLKKLMAGYSATLGDFEKVVIMGLDSATPGRMAIVYYRELTGSEFLLRVEDWHSSFAWEQRRSVEDPNVGRKKRRTIWCLSAPSPRDIVEAVYGQKLDDKLRKSSVERILPCIIERAPFPRDLVESAVRRISRRQSFDEHWEWEQSLGVVCGIIRGYYSRLVNLSQQRRYSMTLEADRTTRDYLYGRLLAYAEHIENKALYIAKENRDTTASKLMQRFADRPFSTWKNIETALVPYRARIRAKWPGYLAKLNEQLDEVFGAFAPEDFQNDSRLSGEFLLGYHCQRQALHNRSDLFADGSTEEENEEQ